MKRTSGLKQLAVLVGLLASLIIGYAWWHSRDISPPPPPEFYAFSFPALPPLTKLDIPSQTVDGITAIIESGYADPHRIFFIIHFSSPVGYFQSTETFLTNADGSRWISLIGYSINPLPHETLTYFIDFNLSEQLDEPQFHGQLFLAFASPADASQIIRFHFDVDVPIQPFLTFNPSKTISIDGVDILLDRVLIAPAHTFVYLCYPNLAYENWIVTGEGLTLNVNGLEANPSSEDWIFDSTVEEGSKGGESGWTPPNKESRCIKFGFLVGNENPTSLTLTIPGLENAMTTVVPEDELSVAYKKLLAQGIDMKWYVNEQRSIVTEYKKLPEGMTEKEAYRRFLEALGYVCKGPWIFKLNSFYFLVH